MTPPFWISSTEKCAAGQQPKRASLQFPESQPGEYPFLRKGYGGETPPSDLAKVALRRAKKEPRSFDRSSFAAPRTPLRVDAEAPGQAPHNQSSTDGWKCQAFAPNIAQRQGQGREPPGLTLARSRYNGNAHGLTAPRGGAAKQRGRSPLPPGTALPGATQRGAAGRGGAGGEPKGQPRGAGRRRTDERGSKRAKHARSKKRARGQKPPARRLCRRSPRARSAPPPKPRSGRAGGNRRPTHGARATTSEARATTRAPAAQRGEAKAPRRQRVAAERNARRQRPSDKAGGMRAGQKGAGAPPRSGRAGQAKRSTAAAREVGKKRSKATQARTTAVRSARRARERARRVWGFMPRWVPARCHATPL